MIKRALSILLSALMLCSIHPHATADETVYLYNPNGGSYYHINPQCETIDEMFLPMSPITIDELQMPRHNWLKPCAPCGCPNVIQNPPVWGPFSLQEMQDKIAGILDHETPDFCSLPLDDKAFSYPYIFMFPSELDLSEQEAISMARNALMHEDVKDAASLIDLIPHVFLYSVITDDNLLSNIYDIRFEQESPASKTEYIVMIACETQQILGIEMRSLETD